MDDSSKTMMLTLASGIIKKALVTVAAGAATHGIISSNQTETFVSAGMLLVGIGWSLWNDYGRAIVVSQLEVMKAKSLAQAAKMKDAGVPPVTVSQIAAASPTMTPADVAKAVSKLPAEVQATVAPVKAVMSMALLAIALAGSMVISPASAQTPKARPTGIQLPFDPLHLNGGKLTGNASADMQALWQKIVTASLDDLNYAAAMAKSANTGTSTVRLQCLNAIIALNRQASGIDLKDASGNALVKPDAHLFTDVESLAEVIDNLSPQGPLFVSCSGAAQLAKTNVLSFVNALVTGAAGLAVMPVIPGL